MAGEDFMNNFDNLCMGCMGDTKGETICPHCDFDNSQSNPEKCLAVKTILQERYLVGSVVDENGEGVGYIGYDTVSKIPVYIREFMPDNLATRENAKNVNILPGCEITFKEYLNEFLLYSRAISRLREVPAFIPMFDIFEENNTAYTISDWVESITLSEFIERRGGSIEWNVARSLFMPVLSSLSEMQKADINHLGISPENLIILRTGKMRLKGFSIASVRQTDTDLKPELFEGCAAIEQYSFGTPLGEYTDIYGFTACLFYALIGTLPQDSLKRKVNARLLIPKNTLKLIPPHVVTAIANGLQVEISKRTASFERLRAELSAAPTVTMLMDELVPVSDEKKREQELKLKKAKRKRSLTISLISCFIALLIFIILSLSWFNTDYPQKTNSTTSSSSQSNKNSNTTSSVNSTFKEATVNIPNLVGVDLSDAIATAKTTGSFQILIESKEFSDTVAEDAIISQTPEYSSETEIRSGSIISVVVSKGSKTRTLPEISGLSLTDAAAKVTDAGLIPQKGSEEYSSVYPEGKVIGYSGYVAGSSLEYGSTVKIIVSKGPGS